MSTPRRYTEKGRKDTHEIVLVELHPPRFVRNCVSVVGHLGLCVPAHEQPATSMSARSIKTSSGE